VYISGSLENLEGDKTAYLVKDLTVKAVTVIKKKIPEYYEISVTLEMPNF